MKIHILPVDPLFQPETQDFVSPPHNEQWNISRDFLAWLEAQPRLLVARESRADWSYLPIFWNAFYINHGWGEELQEELQAQIYLQVSRNRPTFTICEYDIAQMQPHLDLCNMVVFTASRREEGTGIDIPLLCTPHALPETLPEKRYLASFVGNLDTWGIRSGMVDELGERDDCYLEHEQRGTDFFVNLMLESYVALAPRGHGGQSFRFYEAMQLGTVPCYVSDLDCRPFKKWIDWDACSLWLPSPAGLRDLLTDIPRERLLAMGAEAARVYDEHLRYGRWCGYVIKELETL